MPCHNLANIVLADPDPGIERLIIFAVFVLDKKKGPSQREVTLHLTRTYQYLWKKTKTERARVYWVCVSVTFSS